MDEKLFLVNNCWSIKRFYNFLLVDLVICAIKCLESNEAQKNVVSICCTKHDINTKLSFHTFIENNDLK